MAEIAMRSAVDEPAGETCCRWSERQEGRFRAFKEVNFIDADMFFDMFKRS